MNDSLGSLENVAPDGVVVKVCFNKFDFASGVGGKTEKELIFVLISEGSHSSLDLVAPFEEDSGDVRSYVSIDSGDNNGNVLVQLIRMALADTH